MSRGKILCITLIDDIYHCLEIHNKKPKYLQMESKDKAFFPMEPRIVDSMDDLKGLCAEADEIHLSSLFSSAIYQVVLLPKVSKRDVSKLVRQDARKKIDSNDPIISRFIQTKEVSDGGVSKWETAYCSVLESEADSFWNKFRNYRSKIKSISPLPISAASMVAQLDTPSDNFVLICVGAKETIILIASPKGAVYLARTLPLAQPEKIHLTAPVSAAPMEGYAIDADSMEGYAIDADPVGMEPFEAALEVEGEPPRGDKLDSEALQFANEIQKELGMTATYFKQEFRQPAPKRVYLLGDEVIEELFTAHPLPATYEDVHFGVSTEKLRGISRNFASRHIHILGNLFSPDTFNFTPDHELTRRRTNFMLNAAVIVMAAGMGLATAWTYERHQSMNSSRSAVISQLNNLQEARTRRLSMQEEKSRLLPVKQWKQFYDSTLGDTMPWDIFISELALNMEDYVFISSFNVQSGKGRERNCSVKGKIKASDWETGLELFRKFGKRIHSSPMFDVSNIFYTPENVASTKSMFDFNMDIKIKSIDGGAS